MITATTDSSGHAVRLEHGAARIAPPAPAANPVTDISGPPHLYAAHTMLSTSDVAAGRLSPTAGPTLDALVRDAVAATGTRRWSSPVRLTIAQHIEVSIGEPLDIGTTATGGTESAAERSRK
ncbi:hypothetical protein Acsp02_44500 [Actinoplanes sp. NBRC 103695]|nr:hypothetical protein Acsp02_44500 [Actinoplanes sp. NBRC 103695]